MNETTARAARRSGRARDVRRQLDEVRDALLGAQQELKRSKSYALVLIVSGAPAAGRSEVVNELLSWLDPKYVSVYSPDRNDCEDRERPLMWRYWRHLPARGRIAVFFEGWYDGLVRRAVKQKKGAEAIEPRAVERILQFEHMLARDGVRVLKIDLEISQELQHQRIEQLRANKLTRWRVTQRDRWFARHYTEAAQVMQVLRAATDHDACRWHVVDGADEQRRVLDVAKLLEAQMSRAPSLPSSAPESAQVIAADAVIEPAPALTSITEEQYEVELEQLQGRLALLSRRKRFRRHALVLAFEGMDAAGKGGAIRRLTHALDARQYRVIPVGAPSADELLYPYLWRFWREAPRRGEVVIFDRSWYGRVLVERVRSFTAQADWSRAYDEINEMERQWCEHGAVLHKFWLSVSLQEQQKRFEARESDPLKRFKVDPEDWENRKHFDDYQLAAKEMIARTSHAHATWSVVDADSKKLARLQVLRTVVEKLEAMDS